MIGLLQRVNHRRGHRRGPRNCAHRPRLLVLGRLERGDDETTAERLLERLGTYRVFADAEGRMNLSLAETGGALLLVPQFTLAADTGKGLRPGFSRAAAPADAERLFGHMAKRAQNRLPGAQSGQFGAHMRVSLVNDGPVTFWLRVPGHEGAEGNGVS